jgi:putative membrane protein
MEYDEFEEDLGLRDLLALDRTILANERTVLAYARTAVMLGVSSITLLKIFPDNPLAFFTAVALIPISILTATLGLQRFFSLSRSLVKQRRRTNRGSE